MFAYFLQVLQRKQSLFIQVEDVVCYDTYGHAFFFSDGIEVNNTLRHNLGLVTRAGTILPSERNATTCVGLTANISVYTPDPSKDCMLVIAVPQ